MREQGPWIMLSRDDDRGTTICNKLKGANTRRVCWSLAWNGTWLCLSGTSQRPVDRLAYRSPEWTAFEIDECTDSSYLQRGHRQHGQEMETCRSKWKTSLWKSLSACLTLLDLHQLFIRMIHWESSWYSRRRSWYSLFLLFSIMPFWNTNSSWIC